MNWKKIHQGNGKHPKILTVRNGLRKGSGKDYGRVVVVVLVVCFALLLFKVSDFPFENFNNDNHDNNDNNDNPLLFLRLKMLLQQAGNIFANDIEFKVNHRTYLKITKVGVLIGIGYDGHRKLARL